MSLSSDNFTALIHLRDQARKWKNISFLMIVAIILLAFRVLFGANDNVSKNIDAGDYIASINIEGIILDDDYRSEILEKIAEQKNIKAVIVNINSPGGGIVGSEVLYQNLRTIAANKPIVVVMGSLAASGGYMASLAADHIIAHNGTLTGSIGVIMQSSEFTDLASKVGVKFITYKSSILKGAPSPFEKTNPQVDKVINESIKDSYQFFSELVKQRRADKLDKNNLTNIIDGRIFTGRQALKNGLVDEIGGKNEALKYLNITKKIDINKFPVKKIDLEKPEGALLGKLLGEETMAKVIEKITGFNTQSKQLMSIWN
ncbi:MAG: signal peptide peptidase SppA [Pseudomonadota bacterium]